MSESKNGNGNKPQKSKASIWKRLQDNVGFLASLIAVITFAGGFIGWEAGSGSVEKRVGEVVAVTDERLQEAILALPEQQQAALKPLIAAIQDLARAPAEAGGNEQAIKHIETAVGDIAEFSRHITVKSYSAESSPFTLPVGETLMICNNQVSVGLPRLTHNGARALSVISGKQLSLVPGKQVSAAGGATVTLLDILGQSEEAVFAFNCG